MNYVKELKKLNEINNNISIKLELKDNTFSPFINIYYKNIKYSEISTSMITIFDYTNVLVKNIKKEIEPLIRKEKINKLLNG